MLTSFDRPVVQHWPGVAVLRGDTEKANCATRKITRFAPEANTIEAVGEIALNNAPRAHTEVVRFELWEEHPGEEGVYEVLHFSEPELDKITAG